MMKFVLAVAAVAMVSAAPMFSATYGPSFDVTNPGLPFAGPIPVSKPQTPTDPRIRNSLSSANVTVAFDWLMVFQPAFPAAFNPYFQQPLNIPIQPVVPSPSSLAPTPAAPGTTGLFLSAAPQLVRLDAVGPDAPAWLKVGQWYYAVNDNAGSLCGAPGAQTDCFNTPGQQVAFLKPQHILAVYSVST